jgi:hypothetical protein
MNNDSMLQRDWKDRDVQRMRNIIKKDYDAKTTTQVGYTKSQEEHIEGDVWEENGKKWTIKNGLKQTMTRFDELKKLVSLPLTCPTCHKPMKSSHANKIMWSMHKMCVNCVVDMEAQLKKEGKFDEYAKNMIINGMKEHIKELEEMMLEIALNPSEESFVTEAGDIETWKGKGINKEQIAQELQEYIQKLKDITES